MANISPVLESLPIEKLIAAPFKAASDANLALAAGTLQYVNKIGFDNQGNVNLVTFDIDRPIQGTKQTQTTTVNAPLLSLVPIPALLIENVDVDLEVEVTGIDDTTTNVNVELGADFNYKSWWGEVKLYGKLSAAYNNQNSLKQTGRYNVRVSARQQPPTEGMQNIMALFNSIMNPLPNSAAYAGLAPTISAVAGPTGTTTLAVGNIITVTGTNFTGATSVLVGKTPIPLTTCTIGDLQITFPAIASTSGNVSVTTPGGTAISANSIAVA